MKKLSLVAVTHAPYKWGGHSIVQRGLAVRDNRSHSSFQLFGPVGE